MHDGTAGQAQQDQDASAGDGQAALRAFDRSLPMALLRAREAVMGQFRPFLRTLDVTEQQWRVLRALDAVPEIDATRLSQATCLLAPSLTRILRDLEGRKLIRRRADRFDQRAALLSLAPGGKRLLQKGAAQSEQAYRALTARIGAEKLDVLMDLLKEIEGRASCPPSARR